MATMTVVLRRRETIARQTLAFHFDKPAGFEHKPGQSVDLTLIDPPPLDDQGNSRSFSIASSPLEPEIMIATRLRESAFKRVLASLPIGSPLQLDGPMGSFTLHKNSAKPAVLLAGGIGITPFLGMIRQAAAEAKAQTLHLFYSNHRPEDAPFLDELERLAGANPRFHFVPTMTQAAASPSWKGATGRINERLLREKLHDVHGPIYYVAGPPDLVSSLSSTLVQAGVDEDDVRSEEFAGY